LDEKGSSSGRVFVVARALGLSLFVFAEKAVRGGLEIVHLAGPHRPDEHREKEQCQQEREREGDIDG